MYHLGISTTKAGKTAFITFARMRKLWEFAEYKETLQVLIVAEASIQGCLKAYVPQCSSTALVKMGAALESCKILPLSIGQNNSIGDRDRHAEIN